MAAADTSVPAVGATRFFDGLFPMLRAVLWAAIGFIIGAWPVALITGSDLYAELPVTIGYVLATFGWVLGGGAWEGWVRPWFGRPSTWDEGHGLASYFRFNTDHKVIGLQYLWAAIFAFGVAGLIAMAMRIELMSPSLSLFPTNQDYNTAFSIHGTLMQFAVSVVAIVGGFGNYFVPLMVGADDMTFPKLNAVSWWFVLPGVIAVLLSPLLGGFQTGWTGYAPLSAMNAPGQDLYYVGVFMLDLSSLLTAINVIATAMMMGLLDRLIPTNFFSAEGLPVLWQDLFWLFGHPEVYIIMLPA